MWHRKPRREKDKKSVSPVISVILLVGISVAAAALSYSWYVGMQKGTQAATGETAGRTAIASSAAISITNLYYNSSAPSINVTVSNIGGVNATELRLFVDGVQIPLASGAVNYASKDSSTNLWNTTTSLLPLSTGVHTVKVTSKEGGEASYSLVV